jgi:hypothetical protein
MFKMSFVIQVTFYTLYLHSLAFIDAAGNAYNGLKHAENGIALSFERMGNGTNRDKSGTWPGHVVGPK